MTPTLQHNKHTICIKESHVPNMNKENFQVEDDEDLFEIDLEAVGNSPPPCNWESCLTLTTNTLFANCLVPITDASCAVPLGNTKDATWLGPGSRRVIWVRGAQPFRTFAGSSGALSNLLQKTLSASSSFNHGK